MHSLLRAQKKYWKRDGPEDDKRDWKRVHVMRKLTVAGEARNILNSFVFIAASGAKVLRIL